MGAIVSPVRLEPVSAITLTVRHGPKVERLRFDSLEAAVESMRARAEGIRGEGALAPVKAFREYGPEQRVAARLEISTGRLIGGRDAGVDVMGDGSLVPYTGGIRKRPLEASGDPYAAVRRALA
jgi:hypothetical protein